MKAILGAAVAGAVGIATVALYIDFKKRDYGMGKRHWLEHVERHAARIFKRDWERFKTLDYVEGWIADGAPPRQKRHVK